MKEVIILGTGASFIQCPYDCETWGVNGAYTAQKIAEHADKFRMDKLFISDTVFRPDGSICFDIDDMHQLVEERGTQIITLHKMKLGSIVLKSSIYPYKRIVKKFGTEYFTSSIGYMLAYAIDKNYERIRLYGVDMSSTREYAQEKGGVEFWIGLGMGRGIEFEISEGSTIMCPAMGVPYGWRPKCDLKMIDPNNLLGGKKCRKKPPN